MQVRESVHPSHHFSLHPSPEQKPITLQPLPPYNLNMYIIIKYTERVLGFASLWPVYAEKVDYNNIIVRIPQFRTHKSSL